MENLHLIVGLGNPGAEYSQTRHNAGFQVVERLAERWRVRWVNEKKFNARVARCNRDDRTALLCQPQTYMNASGEAVAAVVSFYHATTSRLLIVVDDADLTLGELRLRPGGSSGGHHGLESIEQHLGTRDYARLRVGIGRQGAVREITGHVLSRFSSTETALIDKVLNLAADQAECWLTAGIQKAMSQYNGPVNGATTEGKEK
jgi:PTH1 family peptidyl-tRNA hydrolase